MKKIKNRKFIILLVLIFVIILIIGLFFYTKNKSIFKDKHMMEITMGGYELYEITPLLCSEKTGYIELKNLNNFNTLEDLKLFKKIELIHIGDFWNSPEENIISEKKLDKFIKQLNEAFIYLPNIHILDIENVPYIKDYSFLNNTKITKLYIEYNENIDFDSIYNCSQLEALHIESCDIGVDEIMNINKLTKLKFISIQQDDFKYDSEILDILYKCDNLEDIYLDFDDDISDDEMEYQIRRFKEIGITLNFI